MTIANGDRVISVPVNSHELTPLQAGMLFHSLSAEASGVDIEQVTMHLHEALDVDLFVEAWQQVIARHPILRTRFEWERHETPKQIVNETGAIACTQFDLSNETQFEQHNEISSFKSLDRFEPFDLSTAPLMRLAAFRLAEEEYYILWTFHHILLDGRSFPLLLKQVFAAYEALKTGTSAELPPSRPFSDYVTWRSETNLSTSEKFWRRQLSGFAARTAIDLGAQAAGTGTRWDEVETLLSAEQTTALNTFATSQNVTLHTLLQAAWSLLLHHFSGDDDIVFASTRACRHWADDAGDMIGLYINTLPIRVQVEDDQSLSTYLQALRKQQIELRAHEHTALSDVQRWSEIERGESLFDTLVVFDNLTLNDRMKALGTDWEMRDFTYHGQTNFPLTILAYGGERLLLRIEHQLARFSAETAENMLHQLVTILLGMPANRGAHPLQIPWLSAKDRELIFSNWNPAVARAPIWTVHDEITQQAKLTPNKVAVLSPANKNFRRKGRTLTYAELDSESTELSRHLRQLGVSHNTLVGVCLHRNANLVVALLAVMKAGGAYVPIDPSWPRERINHMLSDSQAPIVIADRKSYDRVPSESDSFKVLDIDNLESLTLSFYRNVQVKPEHLAYVIYTSGSTGKPKGVKVPHGALSNFIGSMQKEPGIGADDMLLAVTTVSFDIAALEIFLPLLNGGTLMLASAENASDGHALTNILNSEPITIMQATPSTWRMLIDSGWQGNGTLKMLCGGEPLPRHLANQLLERGSELWNMYGPTETTIWSTISQVLADGAAITIGRPIDNTSCFILDKNKQPVAPGVRGELTIGGAGVTNGYIERPELTADRFIKDQMTQWQSANNSDATIYRTGDLARYNMDGTLECLGRIDHQVKIRGFRVELGEIESVLVQHDAVQAACVVALEKQTGVHYLAAYIIPKGEMPPITQLRKFSKTKLPDYMIPHVYISMQEFPLTNNGKINRLALPEPDGARPELENPFVAPTTETEKLIANTWRDVLMVDRVGNHDSFFELGGDSLLVVRAVGQLRQNFGDKLNVSSLYEHRTVAELAKHLSVEPEGDKLSDKFNTKIGGRAQKRRAALRRKRETVH